MCWPSASPPPVYPRCAKVWTSVPSTWQRPRPRLVWYKADHKVHAVGQRRDAEAVRPPRRCARGAVERHSFAVSSSDADEGAPQRRHRVTCACAWMVHSHAPSRHTLMAMSCEPVMTRPRRRRHDLPVCVSVTTSSNGRALMALRAATLTTLHVGAARRCSTQLMRATMSTASSGKSVSSFFRAAPRRCDAVAQSPVGARSRSRDSVKRSEIKSGAVSQRVSSLLPPIGVTKISA